MKLTATLPRLLYLFFSDWLIQQRNVSRHTVIAYRDAWRLFLRFVAEQKSCRVARLNLSDLTSTEVLAFLQHIEQGRKVSIATRNCRLTALRSFFLFVADREPAAAAQCAEVLRIPTKRHPQRVITYLEPDEVEAILAQPDGETLHGQRDYALLSFLYNTGARIQEALDVCLKDLKIEPPAHVRLVGKGRKERICPLWQETVSIIKDLLRRQPRNSDEPIFVNRYGDPLKATGVRYRLRQYVAAATQEMPTLKTKRISPHTFRHTTAVHLIASGVDVTVVRSWLGHEQLDTTNLYAQANIETKRKALDQIASRPKNPKRPRWKQNSDLLTWLESL